MTRRAAPRAVTPAEAGVTPVASPTDPGFRRTDSGEPRDASGHLVRELHGVTLKTIVTWLVETLGYEQLGGKLPFQCFLSKPTIKSSLIFLRRTPWARAQVEALYIELKSP